MAGIRLSVANLDIIPTVLQKKLYLIIDNEKTRRGVNNIIANTVDPYIPYKTGALRQSRRVGPKTIAWTTPYARYQYYGEVYGPNFPIMSKGTIVGWWSPEKKHPTGRELGIPGFWKGWKFGYTTPGTKHHWVDKMLQTDKRIMQIRITNYLKKRAKDAGYTI